jgi:hypothetical protein
MAAGLGFKTFVTGDVLTAADTNGYLMQGVLVFADAAARTAAITSPQEGQYSYLKDTNVTEYYSGSAWVSASSGGGANWSLLNAGGTALTAAATITVSGISGKDKIMVIVDSASSANASAQFRITFNSDSGAKYSYYGINNSAQAAWAADNFGDQTSTADTKIQFGMQSSAAAGRVNGYLLVTGCNTAGVKVFNMATGANISSGNTQRQYVMGGLFNDTAVISSVSITSSSGNFDAGTIYIYTSA